MLKPLFHGMLIASDAYYGDAIGLAPISLSMPSSSAKIERTNINKDFWTNECRDNPSKVYCLTYE